MTDEAGDRGDGPREVLRRRARARRGRPRRRARHGVLAARAQRRGQDDDGADPATLVRADGGPGARRGVRRRAERREVRRAISLTGQYAARRRGADRRGEPADDGPAARPVRRATPGRAPRELLARFDLADAAGRRVATYSGGMRRRLDLAASASSAGPTVIFLDEPTTGLDPRSRQRDVGRGRASSSASGVTVFLTTQYLDEADVLADRIAVIDGGRVVAEGTAAAAQAPRRRPAPGPRRSPTRPRSPRSTRCSAAARSRRDPRPPAARRRDRRQRRARARAARRARPGRRSRRAVRGPRRDARRRLPRPHRPSGRDERRAKEILHV